ncbi:MAG: glycosyltransferase [Planctomycetota bacterium]|nr:MAG: glycosyltransferase [Planctomycetota bacterium]
MSTVSRNPPTTEPDAPASHFGSGDIAERDLGHNSVTWPEKRDLFGVLVTPTTYEEATRTIVAAGRRRESSVVSCHAVHAIVTFGSDESLRSKANTFEMITPDGQPVRWALNSLYKTELPDRVCGPELTLRVCEAAAQEGVSIYLYGGSPEVVAQLAKNLEAKYAGLKIAGYESPPFRPLTEEEDAAVIERINASGAGLVFIGLGCPKQDLFAFDHRDRIQAVQLCVGAAFDFHAGVTSLAPAWMQRSGLEWFYRLMQEPKRLARRYFTTNTIYLSRWARALLFGQPRRTIP